MIHNNKDYTGSVYGGLGHLLYTYCLTLNLPISPLLNSVQNLERFPYTTWYELLQEIENSNQIPALGLAIAEHVQPKNLGIIAYLALSSSTLQEALARYDDFHRLIYDGSPLQVSIDQQCICIYWDDFPPNCTTQTTDEIAIALMVQFLKLFMDFDNLHLYEVHFVSSAPKNILYYEQYFRCKVRFSQQKSCLFIPLTELAKPICHADPTLQNLLLQQAQALLNNLPQTTQLDHRLQSAILQGLQKNQCHIEKIAQHVNLSVRQLQRYLQQQNTTFQKRMQEIRLILAQQYLQDCHLSLQEIALLLGYSEQSAFQRAFKLWVGCTPQQWRQHHVVINQAS